MYKLNFGNAPPARHGPPVGAGEHEESVQAFGVAADPSVHRSAVSVDMQAAPGLTAGHVFPVQYWASKLLP